MFATPRPARSRREALPAMPARFASRSADSPGGRLRSLVENAALDRNLKRRAAAIVREWKAKPAREPAVNDASRAGPDLCAFAASVSPPPRRATVAGTPTPPSL